MICTIGRTAFLYQRDGEIIAFARPDPAVGGAVSSSALQAVDIIKRKTVMSCAGLAALFHDQQEV
jgi:hypothetical protein